MMRYHSKYIAWLSAVLTVAAGLLLPPVVLGILQEPQAAPPPQISQKAKSDDSSRSYLTARNKDCGAACLYMICRLAGRPQLLDDLRKQTHTTREGTSLLHLRDTARELGFETEAIRGDFAALCSRVAPANVFAILHVRGNHFIVAEGVVAGGGVRVLDPAREAMLVSEEDLRTAYRWRGVMLCLTDTGEEGPR